MLLIKGKNKLTSFSNGRNLAKYEIRLLS